MIKIKLTSVSIGDYDQALEFYVGKLGFEKKHDVPLGNGARWITVVSPGEPDGTELLLEPNADYPAMKALKADLVRDGIPFTAFQVDDVHAEFERLKSLDVTFTMGTTDAGEVTIAVLDDTCGNLIQIYQTNG